LGLPSELEQLAHLQSGLVLVTGATGSGKSTTLAVLLNEINRTRNCHILTIEDPVEFVHRNQKSLVHHRELHTDVPSFAEAVRAGLREDPDVIMVGEMRDLETMQTSIIAAETGHLVLSTLHSGTAVGAVERFIGAFSGGEQAVARQRFSMALRAVVAQQLLVGANGRGRVPAVELLKINRAASHLIRNSKTEQLNSLMESGAEDGMWTLDQYLARLVKNKKITREVAAQHCHNWGSFDSLVDVAAQEGSRTWL
jgi:twitching motility protein PilT